MTVSSFGDLAQHFGLRKHQTSLRAEVERLTLETTTGKKSDIANSVNGDFRPLSSIEAGLIDISAHLTTVNEVSHFADAIQLSLDRIEEEAINTGAKLALLASAATNEATGAVGSESRAAFSSVVDALNARFAGRALFSGTKTDTAPLPEAHTMLADIQSVVAGETTAAGVIASVDAWFGNGGAFETTHYSGSTTQLAQIRMSDSVSASFTNLASDEEFRSVLSGLALGALVDRGPLTASPEETSTLAKAASERAISSSAEITQLGGTLGVTQGRIETHRTHLMAEQGALDLARNSILETDPYEAASRLQEVQTQLEVLYSVTARTARLSLANFLQ